MKKKKVTQKEIKRLFKKFPKRLETWDIEDVKLWKDNPNDDFSTVDKLGEIFKKFGQITPVVVWSKNSVCYKGNHTTMALKRLGEKKIEVLVVDFPSREMAELYGLADNQAGKLTELSNNAIVKLLQADRIKSFADEEDIRMMTGFSEKEFKAFLLSTESLPDKLPDVDIEGFIPCKTNFLVIQFEDKDDLDSVKGLLGVKTEHQRVINFKLLKPFIAFGSKPSKKIRHKRR